MSTTRQKLPGVDALFGGGHTPPAPAPPAPANTKISVYLPDDLLASVDMMRAQLQLEQGLRVDRSKVIRVAMRLALIDPEELANLLEEADA